MAINLNVGGNTDPLEAAVRAAVDRIRRQPIKITVDDKGVTQPLGNMKRGADEFNKSMEAANARIIAFGASMAILNGISESFKQMVRNLVEVEKALQDINVVMGLSVDNLNRFSSGLFKVAKETGAAFNVAAEAATEYARQGLSMEESLKRTRDALILTRLTGMDSANAVKALTAAMNTYGHQIKDTTELVSKFAAVDVKFAVSAEDFADAISRTGAAAKGAGVSIDELIGIVTAAQQQTARGGKVIGNSLKTIFTRIGKTSTLNQLEQVGIAVRDLEGNTIGAKKILTDLANTFDKLSAAQQAQVTQSVGGVFQINILKAVLSDAAKQNGIMAQATSIASGATDEAIQKNEMLRQTMAALASETGMALKEVSAAIGEIMLAPGIEKVLNTVKGIAEGITGMLGDGEEEGNRFAKGVLSGLGNILTGPGLVILTVVFGKLFFKAFQYGKDSLKSLIGVTTEKQKQAAIQQALVELFARSSNLNKEMLRTDIDKVQKQKTILTLLREQTKEANLLNAVSKSASKTLFAAGYKSNLSKKTNASGHVPNFSEREQAAKGGYAAGNIRTMNMPGQGTVIYNSAETVKNFAGMKQPGILPPKGSRAGKNYREGFGGIHGFDPYAAGGYVPNFKKEGLADPRAKKSEKWDKAKKVIDATQYATMLIPSVFPDTVAMTEGGENVTMGDLEKKKSLTRLGTGHSAIKGPGSKIYGLNLDRSVKYNLRGLDPGKVDGQKMGWSTDSIIKGLQTQGYAGLGASIGNSLKLGNVPGISDKDIIQAMNDPSSGAKGAINSVAGAIFEGALNKRLNIKGGAAAKSKSGLIMGGDFDVRHLDATAHKHLESLFGSGIAPLADYKNSASDDNRKSFAKKILQDMVHKKSTLLSLSYGAGGPKKKAGGFIPNFAKGQVFKLPKGTTTGRGPAANLKAHGKKGGALGGVPASFKKYWEMVPPVGQAILQGAATVGTGFMGGVPLFGTLGAIAAYGVIKSLKQQGKDRNVLKAMKGKGAPPLPPGLGAAAGFDVMRNALGFIPNYADPLSDAIGRERGAGVPVSKIRVGQHPSLMGGSNPMGFGVTNTKDEPRGLTDIFGANGMIPNYAMSDRLKQTWEFITSKSKQILNDKQKEWVGSDAVQKKSRAQQLQMISVRQKSTNVAIQMTREESIEAMKQLEFSKEETVQAMKQKDLMGGASEGDIGDMFDATDDEGVASGGFGGWAKEKLGKLDRRAKKSMVGGAMHKVGGKLSSGMGGMALMMGAPMVAGMLTEGNETSTGAQAAGGALTGAGTGAAMGMMFGPWGAAIGAAGGALMGFVGGIQKADEASRAAADAIRKETHERDKANRGQMFGGLADKLYAKASVASFNANRRIEGEASGSKFTGKVSGHQGYTTWLADKAGGVLTSVPEMIRDLGDDSTDLVDDALQGVFKGNFGAKGKVAAKKLGLEAGTFGDTVEFTRENEGDWFDYADHDAASSLVAADILNKQISAGGGKLSGGRGSAHMLDMSAEELSGYQEDLRAALIVALGDEGLAKMAENAKTSASFMEAFSSDLEKAGIKEAPKNLADAVANFAFVDFSEGTEGEINRKLGTAGSVIDDYINSLDDNVEMQMNIGGEMKIVNKRILQEEHKKAKKSKTEVELYGAIGDELAKRRQAAKAQRAVAIKALNFQKIQVQLQSALNKNIKGLSHSYKMASLNMKLIHARMGNSLGKGIKIIEDANMERKNIMVGERKSILQAEGKFRDSSISLMKSDEIFLKIKSLMAGGQGEIAKNLSKKGGFGGLLGATGEDKTGADFALQLKDLSSEKTKVFLETLLESEHISSKLRIELESVVEALASGKDEAKLEADNLLRQLDISTQIKTVQLEINRIKKIGAEDLILENLKLQNKAKQESLRLEISLNKIKASAQGRVLDEGQAIEQAEKTMNEQKIHRQAAADVATSKRIRDVFKGDIKDQQWTEKRQNEAMRKIAPLVDKGDFEGVRNAILNLTTPAQITPKTQALKAAKAAKATAGTQGGLQIPQVMQQTSFQKQANAQRVARGQQPFPSQIITPPKGATFEGSTALLKKRDAALSKIHTRRALFEKHKLVSDIEHAISVKKNRVFEAKRAAVIKNIAELESANFKKMLGMDPYEKDEDMSRADREKFDAAMLKRILRVGMPQGPLLNQRPMVPNLVAAGPSAPLPQKDMTASREQRAEDFLALAEKGGDAAEILDRLVVRDLERTQEFKNIERDLALSQKDLADPKVQKTIKERRDIASKWVKTGVKTTPEEDKLLNWQDRRDVIAETKKNEEGVVKAYNAGNDILQKQLHAHDRRIEGAQALVDGERHMTILKDKTNRKIKEIIANREIEKNLGDIILAQKIEEAKILRQRKMGEYGRPAWREALVDLRGGMQNELDYFEYNLTQNVAGKFKDGMVDAIQAAINKSEDLGDSLRNLAIDLLGMIQKAFLQRAVGMMMTPLFGALGMSSGGQVPARVSNGEYVMSRGAVNRYDGGFMHGLNARGKVPGYAHGGEHKNEPGSALATGFGGGEGWESGNLYQKKAMSGFFYSGASGNQLLGEDTSTAKGIIAERERKRAEKKAKKRALMQSLLTVALTAGLTYGMGQMFGGASATATGTGATGNIGGGASITPTGGSGVYGGSGVMESSWDLSDARLGQMFPNYNLSRGGAIRKYAPGGYISGKSGIDQIPAMLSEGEYVIKQSSVQRLGRPLLDRINAGKFADGGPTSPIAEQSETSATGGGNTNNINISVNVAKGGEKRDKEDVTGESPSDVVEEDKKNKALAEKLRSEVVTIIVEEQRPGGLLDA